MKKIIFSIAVLTVFAFNIFAQTYNDATLSRVALQDKSSRDANGKLNTLSAAEHALRADVYSTNRQFPQAREHWQKILDVYPNDANLPKALFGVARSYMWERDYEKAVFWFDRLTGDYLNTKEGREGLAFKGASLVRLNKNLEAAKTYEQYTIMFPLGERIESSFLNIIDALREAKRYDEANFWVDKTRQRFSGKRAETNALHARLRMEIFRSRWNDAIAAADVLLNRRQFSDSMTSADEVRYLKAFVLEKAGRKVEAINVYQSIADNASSYYGGLATERLKQLGLSDVAAQRASVISNSSTQSYPVMYRAELLRSAKSKNIDPRFVLAIMKQESSFRASAKSPSAARGLLQLVYDTALKYNTKAGFPNMKPDDLYQPNVNITIGSVYISELKNQFGGLYEAIAASYNGGEDNAARWLERSKPKEAAIFASEVGFAESKNYVFKVMNNYRVYRELYTEDLRRK
ncbi:MAG: transglycosylase SLT domain-containing protein [Acidobacteria bacterium]|nr:transglycosylase SLT domain-containing protein [Acidobacteriota bacterium]MCA1639443.1 transglycosylase SLT domain-containing protein [Acidobacteriota bacterium]